MNLTVLLRKWLSAPPLTGMPMLLCALAAITAPTLVYASVDEVVQGTAFITYLPFVTLTALLLDWRAAGAVALASAALGDFLFVGPRFELFETPSDLFGLLVFGVTAVLIIATAWAIRKVGADPLWLNGPHRAPNGVVFSLKDGQACVSWYGGKSFVPLGAGDDVARMMQDFLAQQEVGERLLRRR
ncbi:DUF4118 domain-containing protein [Phenylobacterium terrae]|uniref:DUF4118 domain-containing protein n=1 Tax=Phenylobacterium terrae TaxID=2665495 RepID=A0ABW4N4G0_9CAUL